MAEPSPQGPESAPPWHALETTEALRRLESSREGLGLEEVRRRTERYGPNTTPVAPGKSIFALALSQLASPLIWVLLVSAGLAVALGKVLDGAIVAAVVVLNTIIGVIQEYRATRAIAALSALVPEVARVVRGGAPRDVEGSTLVPGDVVLLAAGDRVAADGRVIESRELEVDESALTGESLPVPKQVEPVEASAGLADRRSLVFRGTFVTRGTATVAMVATGASTELGRISALLEQAEALMTPLTRALARVAKLITIGVVVVAAAIIALSMARGAELVDALLASVALAVAAIPEGLPAIVTIALSIGVSRMARRRAVIRRLPAVETLGSTSVICSDKTGTLTRNEMTVQSVWALARGESEPERWTVSGVGYAPEGKLYRASREHEPSDALLGLLEHAVLCNDGDVAESAEGWRPSGDPTEVALVVAARKAGIDVAGLRRDRARAGEVPFESATRVMATIDGSGRVSVKGAPEAVLARCAIDESTRGAAHEAASRMAERGLRVLAIAERELPAGASLERDAIESGLRLTGLVGMIDPPRPEVVDAIRACHSAGIAVKMITGDHPETARAIGEQIGLDVHGGVVTGAVLERTSDAELVALVQRHGVFARVAPEHKLRLVRALQARGAVVAMTGDGVNDAPALKQADIGVAMGITGTAVAREASDMVLADDNFASIAAAVEEGRRVYDNLIKSLAFVLPTNLGLALILMLAVAVLPSIEVDGVVRTLLPLEPSQILWINLITTVSLALPLAFEAEEPGLMARPPRDPAEPVLSAFVLQRTVVVAVLMAAAAIGLFLFEYHADAATRGHEIALREAQTMALTTVVLFQVIYVVQCRSLTHSPLQLGLFSNAPLLIGMLVIVLLQLGVVYLPFAQPVLATAPLVPRDLALCVGAAAALLPVVTIEKALRRRRAQAVHREPA